MATKRTGLDPELLNAYREIKRLGREALDFAHDSRTSPDQLVLYVNSRLAGTSHNLAEMFATRSFPGIKGTDAIFTSDWFSGDDDQNPYEQVWLREQAEAAGVSTTGKKYLRGLADYPGDPTAWVGGQSDVLAVAKAKNMTVHGYVEHEGIKYEGPDPFDRPYRVADDLIERELDSIIGDDLSIDRDDLREQVREIREGRVDPNPLLVQDTNVQVGEDY